MRSTPNFLVLSLSVAILATGIARAEVREWTRSADGRKITAEYVGMKDEDTVRIKMSNGTFEVPVSSLSEGDREYIKAQQAAEEEGMKEEGEGAVDATIPEGKVKVTLSGVHICCSDCEDKIDSLTGGKSMKPYPKVEFEADRKDKTVEIDAPSGKAAMYALEVLFKAGFCGVSDHPVLTVPPLEERDFETSVASLRDLHICCNTCLSDLEEAVKTVEGVEEIKGEVGDTSVMVKGSKFKPTDVVKAAREAGFGTSFR